MLATVKDGVRGEVVPPNQVVYRDGFDGLTADVLYVWKHNFFSQNVILKKRPVLAPEMDPATTRLEVVSELVESPEPVLNSRVVDHPDGSKRRDDVTFRLGSLLTLHGKAFPVSGEKSLVLTGDPLADENSVGVAKEYFQLEDGRKFLIESVGWDEIQPMLKTLDTAAVGNAAGDARHLADSRSWPDRVAPLEKKEPMQLASAPYQSTGFLVDVSWVPLSGSTNSYTFLSGKTYYIAQSFYIASTATTTFQPGCVIKYGNNAWLLLHCPFTFPPSGQLMPVLTSKDDDKFGVMIYGSTHVPSEMADGALWLYFVTEQTTEIKNVRIRYAKKSIRLDAYNGAEPVHTVKDSLLQYGQDGIYGSMTDGTVILDNVKQCDVDQPVNCTCFAVVGSMTADCSPFYTVANFAGIKQQGESGAEIPDTMGAVGPNHFMVILNGDKSVAVYNKYTGTRLSPSTTTLRQFFTLTIPSGIYAGTYPNPASQGNGMIDSQLIYDQESGRWIACSLDTTFSGTSATIKNIILAISNTADPFGSGGIDWVNNNWKKYLVPFALPSSVCDFDRPTLGVDKNGIYICANDSLGFCGPPLVRIAAIPKAPLVSNPPTASLVQENHIIDVPYYGGENTIYAAVNFEPISVSDPAWFIFKLNDKLHFNRLKWVNGMNSSPQWELSVPGEPGAWPDMTITESFLDLFNGVVDVEAPQLGDPPPPGERKVRIDGRLMNALTRRINGVQYLWTCHAVGVNKDGTHLPTASPPNPADRSGIAWYRIQLDSTATMTESGRVYDNAATNPRFYYTPSLAVNKNGDMALGCSGSSETHYIGAYYTGRLGTGGSFFAPILFFDGNDWHDSGTPNNPTFKWGDYSSATLDPDGVTMWTIQAYAETRYATATSWGTRIVAVSRSN